MRQAPLLVLPLLVLESLLVCQSYRYITILVFLSMDSFVATSDSVVCCLSVSLHSSQFVLPLGAQNTEPVTCTLLDVKSNMPVCRYTTLGGQKLHLSSHSSPIVQVSNENPPPILCNTISYPSHSCRRVCRNILFTQWCPWLTSGRIHVLDLGRCQT